MNEYELQRVIRFLKRTRQPFVAHVSPSEPDAAWNIVTHLIECEIAGQPVTVSTLIGVSELPYATALRRVHRMIDDGSILKRCRSATGKSFTLHPSPDLMARFEHYARQIKCLLAETFGRSMPVEDESDFYLRRRRRPAAARRHGAGRAAALPPPRRQLLRVHAQHVGRFPQQPGDAARFRDVRAARPARAPAGQCPRRGLGLRRRHDQHALAGRIRQPRRAGAPGALQRSQPHQPRGLPAHGVAGGHLGGGAVRHPALRHGRDPGGPARLGWRRAGARRPAPSTRS